MSNAPVRSSAIRALRRLVQLLVVVVIVLIIASLLIGGASVFGAVRRFRMVQFLTPIACRLFALSIGLRVDVVGDRSRSVGVFVGNHVSYLDIIVAGIGVAGVFVSRHDVRNWPVIGLLARIAGTLFLDRASMRSAVVGSTDIVERAGEGIRIALFPEGGTTPGEGVAEFRPFLFKGMAQARIAVQPFVIDYLSIGESALTPESKDLVYWYDPAPSFTAHGWRMLGLRSIHASLTFLPPITAPPSAGRDDVRLWAESLRQAVADGMKRKM